MAPPPNAGSKNKRRRKRKRVEFSSSSSSDGSDSDSSVQPQPVQEPVESSSESSSSASSSSSDSESDEGDVRGRPTAKQGAVAGPSNTTPTKLSQRQRSTSRTPSPPSTPIPSFLPDPTKVTQKEREDKETELKARFRKFWMASIADEFSRDLDEIRKEPGLTQSRLQRLIDGLATGAEAFAPSPSKAGGPQEVNEMELVLEAAELAGSSKK